MVASLGSSLAAQAASTKPKSRTSPPTGGSSSRSRPSTPAAPSSTMSFRRVGAKLPLLWMVAAEREPTWDTEFEFNATGGIIGELIRSYLRSFSSELWYGRRMGLRRRPMDTQGRRFRREGSRSILSVINPYNISLVGIIEFIHS